MPGDGDNHESASTFATEHTGKQVRESISGRSGTVCGFDGPNVRVITCSGLEFHSPARRLSIV